MTQEEVRQIMSGYGRLEPTLGTFIKLCLRDMEICNVVYLACVGVPESADEWMKEFYRLAKRILENGYLLVDARMVSGAGEPISIAGRNRLAVEYALKLFRETYYRMKKDGMI